MTSQFGERIEECEEEGQRWREQFEKSEGERVMLIYEFKKLEEVRILERRSWRPLCNYSNRTNGAGA